MKYKFSKYNICYLKKDVYLIFNTLQWKIVAVNQHDYEMFHEEDKVQLNKRVDTCLKDYEMYGLIVREDVNEDTYVEYKINEAKYDNDLCITLVPTEACNFRCIDAKEELMLDSLQFVSLIADLEDYYAIRIAEEFFRQMTLIQ